MPLRRALLALALTAALVGCEPSTPPSTGSGGQTQYVVYDPTSGQIPLPNDLAWMQAPSGTPRTAQAELLQLYAAQHGFPNDQEMAVTVDVQQWRAGAAPDAPDATFDLTSLTPSTFAFLEKAPGAVAYLPVDPSTYEVAYAKGADRGTLTIRSKPDASRGGTRAWRPGSQYVVVLLGGAAGAKLEGQPLTQAPTMYLITRGVDLSKPENEYLLPGSRDARAVLGAQLEAVRQQYLPLFAAAEAPAAAGGFGWGAGASKDIVSIQTFTIAAPHATQVVADESAGVMPLPSDFLLDPVTGRVVDNPAFGPLASGIATLDGFSTTAMILAQTSGPIAVEKVNGDTVFLYELPQGGSPVRVKELAEGAGAGFAAEPLQLGTTLNPDFTPSGQPCTTAAGCFASAIGLQPAVPVPASTGLAFLPPLKEATEYAVIITTDVLAVDPAATPPLAALQPTTLGRMLLFANAFVDASGKSQLPGVSDATAAGLERMRQGVNAAAAALATDRGIGKDHIAMAYTFRTQGITQPLLQLAAAPYQNPSAFVPGQPVPYPESAFPSGMTMAALPAVEEVLSVPVPTLDAIDASTGAMNPDPTKWKPMLLNTLVFVPHAAAVPASCPGAASGLRCAPLVVFQHGIGRTKSDAFYLANALTAAGFVVAASDEPLHGDNAYCTQDAECGCPPGSTTCTPSMARCALFAAGAQGDAGPVGACVAPSVAVPAVSGRFFVSGNLFRTRDAIREEVLDTSAVILALAPPTTPSDAFAAGLAAKGMAVDGRSVYLVGQSLGAMDGVLSVAANPRLDRAVLNVPGATIADIFTSSPSFTNAQPGNPPDPSSPVGRLLASIGVTYGTPGYLQFLAVAKWILDPADPINFARHLLGDADHPTLPDLLSQKPNQQAKQIFGQYALCDQTIPNPLNLLLFDQIGLPPTPVSSGTSGFTAYDVSGERYPNCTSASSAAHGFLLDLQLPQDIVAAGQGDVAAYLVNGTLPTKAVRP